MDRTIRQGKRAAMYSANRLKLGLFGANCSSGRAVTMVPERWSGSRPDCLRLAQMAAKRRYDVGLDRGIVRAGPIELHACRNDHAGRYSAATAWTGCCAACNTAAASLATVVPSKKRGF